MNEQFLEYVEEAAHTQLWLSKFISQYSKRSTGKPQAQKQCSNLQESVTQWLPTYRDV